MRVTGTKDLGALRSAAKMTIDVESEKIRNHPQLLSPGSGMALVYKEKHLEALAYAADPESYVEGDYPLLEASVGIESENIQQQAQIVLYMANLWKSPAAEIEKVRLGTKMAVDEARTPAGIEAAVQQGLAGLQQINLLLSGPLQP